MACSERNGRASALAYPEVHCPESCTRSYCLDRIGRDRMVLCGQKWPTRVCFIPPTPACRICMQNTSDGKLNSDQGGVTIEAKKDQ